MLSCVLSQNYSNQSQSKSTLSQSNIDSTLIYDEIQSITLNSQNITEKSSKFPLLRLINGWLSSNQNFSENDEESLSIDSSKLSSKLSSEIIENQSIITNSKFSVVFIRNNDEKVYKLTFNTVNCTVIPLFTKERCFKEEEREKRVQPYSKSYFMEEYTPELTRLNTRRKEYKLNFKKEDNSSLKSLKQKFGLIRKTEQKTIKIPNGISANKTNLKKSVIFLKVHNIDFKLSPKMMSLEFSKSLNHEKISTNLVRDLGLETHDQKKNKGLIIAKCHGDILKFSFQMKDINYQFMPEMITRACQIKDDSVYIKCYSDISCKIVNVPLPRNIYKYKDPMVEIKRKNRSMKFNHIDPLWMSETRKNRLTSHKLCQQVDPAQKAYEATNGSNIVYEGQGTLNKAKEGLISCEIISNHRDRYERWVTLTQKENLHQILDDEDQYENYESVGSHDVPDWDLTIYTK